MATCRYRCTLCRAAENTLGITLRDLGLAIYQISGLHAVASPWIATLVLHLALAGYLATAAWVLVVVARGPLKTAHLVTRLFAWGAAVATLSAGLLSAVLVQSFLKYREPAATASAVYDAYVLVCFAVPAVLFLWLLHRGGFSRNWQ